MKVSTNEDRCVGAGQCVIAAPETFDQREDDGTVIVLVTHPSRSLQDSVRDAAEFCPGQAITIIEHDD